MRQIGFLARFAAILLVVVIGMSAGLSYLFVTNHLNAVRKDISLTAAGQASHTLQPVLDFYGKAGAFTEADRQKIDAAVKNVQNFQPSVLDVRIYRPDGQPLDPILAPDATANVRLAITTENFVQVGGTVRGQPAETVFVPMAASSGGSYLAVLAVDISEENVIAATADEAQYIVAATVAACLVIFLSLLTLAIAAQRELNRRRDAAEKTFLQTMEGIATIVDQRDPYTAGHSRRVSEYAAAVARHMHLSEAEIERVRWSALLHDLGKIGVPDVVLLKEGPLDAEERNVINTHPSIAAQILGPVEAMRAITPCVLHHHERWDGKGYPDGLMGEAIPLLSRIIAVADTFDAMTTTRPYRKALEITEARKRLLDGGGVQWDTKCVEAIVALIDAGSVAPPSAMVLGRRLSASHPA